MAGTENELRDEEVDKGSPGHMYGDQAKESSKCFADGSCQILDLDGPFRTCSRSSVNEWLTPAS